MPPDLNGYDSWDQDCFDEPQLIKVEKKQSKTASKKIARIEALLEAYEP